MADGAIVVSLDTNIGPDKSWSSLFAGVKNFIAERPWIAARIRQSSRLLLVGNDGQYLEVSFADLIEAAAN